MEEPTGWQKPKKSFKIRKSGVNKSISTAPSSSQERLLPSGDRQVPSSSTEHPSNSLNNKRRNPFSNQPSEVLEEKRRKLSENFFRSSESGFNRPSKTEDFGRTRNKEDLFNVNYSSSSTTEPDQVQEEQGRLQKPASALPLDWTLKTRSTFSSPQSWLWREHLSTVESASSITGGVRCLDIAKGEHCLDTSASTQFHAACIYWQHPSLPGLPLYPRYGQSSMSKVERLTLSPDMHRYLVSEWIDSLQCVYQLVKARQCPYFYVCSSTFTCLFRAAGIGGSQQILALLSPTTSGLRAALKREDVEYTLPLQQATPEGVEQEEDKGEATDILESLGIEADSLPGFNTSSVKTMTQAGVTQDGRFDSLVCVEGVECQSLLNYLLNAKLSQGPAGVPPTILAPVAFPGAVLKTLKVKEHTISARAGRPTSFQIDVQGPILPHTLQVLTQLSLGHSPALNLRTYTQEETVSFALFRLPTDSVAPSAFASAGLNDCGLAEGILKKFCQVSSAEEEEEASVIRELDFRNGSFHVVDPGIHN